MNGWLKTIIGYFLLVNIAMQMIPNKKYEQYVRLFTGFLLMILILQPVLKIRSADQFLENKVMQFVHEQEVLEDKIGKESEYLKQNDSDWDSSSSEPIEILTIEPVEVLEID